MKRNTPMLLLALVLVLVLLVLISVALKLTGAVSGDPQPSDTSASTGSENPTGTAGDTQTDPTPNPSEDSTDPPTQPPTDAPTQPPTQAPTETQNHSQSGGETIGKLYTRAELEAMDTTYNPDGYGAGKASGGNRPSGPVSDQNKYGQYGGNFIGPDNKNIYLTFDCGFEYTATDANGNKYRVTERILDVLKEKNVKAVFFVTMYYVTDQPDLVQRMIDEGHAVGNHTNNHPVMPKQTIDNMVYEVMSLHDYVKEHFGYEMTLFRPPTGAFSVQSLSVLKSLGYKSMLWSFQYYDYDTEDQMAVDKALERVTSSHHNGAIYLLHAISTTNAALLPDAIDFFRAEGYNLALFQ